MPRLIRNRALAEDRYTLLRDAATLADVPDGVPIIVPLALWSERRVALIASCRHGQHSLSSPDGVFIDISQG